LFSLFKPKELVLKPLARLLSPYPSPLSHVIYTPHTHSNHSIEWLESYLRGYDKAGELLSLSLGEIRPVTLYSMFIYREEFVWDEDTILYWVGLMKRFIDIYTHHAEDGTARLAIVRRLADTYQQTIDLLCELDV
jgi:hypothetical protein